MMIRKYLVATLLALGVAACAPSASPAAPMQTAPVSGRPPGNGYVYRVWIARSNPRSGKDWWEIYTRARSADEAQRIVNMLEDIGYAAYYDSVNNY